MKIVYKILLSLVACILLLVLTYRFVGQPQQISGNSMSPFLKNGSFIITSKITYLFRSPGRGDIVTFKVNRLNMQIGRIIGLPGETIQIADDKVYINGAELYEPYLQDGTRTLPHSKGFPGFVNIETGIKVPENNFFVLSDKREDAVDSRAFGHVQRNAIYGTVLKKLGW